MKDPNALNVIDLPARRSDLTAAVALLDRFEANAPRYTSYPTAPHFSPEIGPNAYETAVRSLTGDDRLSLYAHIPFCDTLCWFCACRTQGAKRRTAVSAYLETLEREINAVGDLVAPGVSVDHVHWGGGSPTVLLPEESRRLMAALRAAFTIAPGAEIAVEIDPRDATEERLDALADIGLTRASLGVQDFDPEIQARINRDQSVELTARVIAGLRARGVGGVNIDALYGLPGQTVESLATTVDRILELEPDRIALFGYAHVPWMAPRQKMIEAASLPDRAARLEQSLSAAERLEAGGYVRIGFDHFAKPTDALAAAAAAGRLRRNFQGYVTDDSDALLGLGASAISRTPAGYFQNIAATAGYLDAIKNGGLATSRGYLFTDDDRAAAAAIERLLCDLRLDLDALPPAPPEARQRIRQAAQRILQRWPDLARPIDGGFALTPVGRIFVRNLATEFDFHHAPTRDRHSLAV